MCVCVCDAGSDLSYNQVEKLGKNALGGMNMLQSLYVHQVIHPHPPQLDLITTTTNRLLQHNSIRSIHSKVFRQRRRLRHL